LPSFLFSRKEKKVKKVPLPSPTSKTLWHEGVEHAHGTTQQLTALKAPTGFSFAFFSFLPKRKEGEKSSSPQPHFKNFMA
jgi:hypothetical protein